MSNFPSELNWLGKRIYIQSCLFSAYRNIVGTKIILYSAYFILIYDQKNRFQWSATILNINVSFQQCKWLLVIWRAKTVVGTLPSDNEARVEKMEFINLRLLDFSSIKKDNWAGRGLRSIEETQTLGFNSCKLPGIQSAMKNNRNHPN